MFSFFSAKKPLSTDIENEPESVKNFLQNSCNFQQMKAIAPTAAKVVDIENTKSYPLLKYTLSIFNIEDSDNIFLYAMGHNAASIFTRSVGLFSENARFFYFGMQLYDEVETQIKNYLRFTKTNEYVKQELIETELGKILPSEVTQLVNQYAADESTPYVAYPATKGMK